MPNKNQPSKRLSKVEVYLVPSLMAHVFSAQETNVGKVINNLRKHDNEVISSKAKEIVCSWREIVQEEVEETEAEQERPQSLACKAARNENGETSKHR